MPSLQGALRARGRRRNGDPSEDILGIETGQPTVPDACAVSIEVDGRQRYLFETDKLREMLGASRLMDELREVAVREFGAKGNLHVFSLVSGEVRAWALASERDGLLDVTWTLREWLDRQGIAHTVAFLDCGRRHFEGDAKADLTPEEQAQVRSYPGEPASASLAWVHHALGARVRRRKDAKAGEDATPTCSLFARCRLHGLDAANRWTRDPRNDGDEKPEPRRQLVSERAWRKFLAWEAGKTRADGFYARHLKGPLLKALGLPPERAVQFRDLTIVQREVEASDSYLAFLCADGDGMGTLLASLDWNAAGWNKPPGSDTRAPWQRNLDFTYDYDALVKTAFANALVHVVSQRIEGLSAEAKRRLRSTKPDLPLTYRVPLLPQVLGGDDLWMVAERSVALDFVTTFQREYETLGADPAFRAPESTTGGTLRRALVVAGLSGKEKMTVSAGVAFAKAGHPAYAMAEAAEALMASAKRLRKGKIWKRPGALQGCVDWHWIASSLSQSVGDARAKHYAYRNGHEVMLLTTRPWTSEQTAGLMAAVRLFACLPRRKREQLESILRRGRILSELGWEAWWKGLGDGEEAVDPATLLRTMNELLASLDPKPGAAGAVPPASVPAEGDGQTAVQPLPQPGDAPNPTAQVSPSAQPAPEGWRFALAAKPGSGSLWPWRFVDEVKPAQARRDPASSQAERYYATVLIDLLELLHVFGLEGTPDLAESEDRDVTERQKGSDEGEALPTEPGRNGR